MPPRGAMTSFFHGRWRNVQVPHFDGHDSRGKEKETAARGWATMLPFFKLRHNFSQEDLATRFGVNQSTMSRLYSCWTKILEACINEFPLWPDMTLIQESVQATFKNLYPDTRVIIDSAEIETDRSHNPILSLWCGSTTSIELWRAASFIHSQVHCNQKACEGVHIFDNFDSSFRRSTSKKNKWIFSCITSRFSVLPVCLPPLYYFSFLFFFFKFALLMTVPQSAHLCDATEHLQLCTDLMGLLWSCNSTYFFTFFCLSALLHSIFFCLFFSNFALSMTALMLIRAVDLKWHFENGLEIERHVSHCAIFWLGMRISFFWLGMRILCMAVLACLCSDMACTTISSPHSC